MVNEGALILSEGKAQRASDIDVVWIYGYGWPVYRGGPMFWAGLAGTDQIAAALEKNGFAVAPLVKEAEAAHSAVKHLFRLPLRRRQPSSGGSPHVAAGGTLGMWQSGKM